MEKEQTLGKVIGAKVRDVRTARQPVLYYNTVLGRDGTRALEPVYYHTSPSVRTEIDDGVPPDRDTDKLKQRRDVPEPQPPVHKDKVALGLLADADARIDSQMDTIMALRAELREKDSKIKLTLQALLCRNERADEVRKLQDEVDTLLVQLSEQGETTALLTQQLEQGQGDSEVVTMLRSQLNSAEACVKERDETIAKMCGDQPLASTESLQASLEQEQRKVIELENRVAKQEALLEKRRSYDSTLVLQQCMALATGKETHLREDLIVAKNAREASERQVVECTAVREELQRSLADKEATLVAVTRTKCELEARLKQPTTNGVRMATCQTPQDTSGHVLEYHPALTASSCYSCGKKVDLKSDMPTPAKQDVDLEKRCTKLETQLYDLTVAHNEVTETLKSVMFLSLQTHTRGACPRFGAV